MSKIPSTFQFSQAYSKVISPSNSSGKLITLEISSILFSKFSLITIPAVLNPTSAYFLLKLSIPSSIHSRYFSMSNSVPIGEL